MKILVLLQVRLLKQLLIGDADFLTMSMTWQMLWNLLEMLFLVLKVVNQH